MRYVPSTLRLASALGLGLILGLPTMHAAEAQSSIGDCEKIQAADAYNQCLAKFGPSGKNLNMEPEKPGDVKGSAEEAAAGSQKAPRPAGRHAGRHRGHGGGTAHRTFGGRKRATFTIHRRKR